MNIHFPGTMIYSSVNCDSNSHYQTRMHSSRMHTACSFTVSHSICHTCTPCHAQPLPCMPPCHACPLPCMPSCHAPLPHTPPCMPPAMYAPLPCMPPCHSYPPAMHAPSATHAPHHACPPTMHAPCRACPPTTHTPCNAHPPWQEFLTHTSENITLPQLRCGR